MEDNKNLKENLPKVESEDENQAKINFLSSAIQPNEIDAFSEFCTYNKNKKISILEIWTIEELEKVVSEFKAKLSEEAKVQNEMKRLSSVVVEYDSNVISKSAKLLNKSSLNYAQATVIISNPIIIQGGLFSSNYVQYEVKTDPLAWLVKRRFSDFENLSLLLSKQFPGICVPPLPSKKIGTRRFDDDYIKKRQKSLQIFIDLLMKENLFKAYEGTINFLSITDRDIFDKKTKDLLNKSEEPNFVEDYLSLTGEVYLSYDEDIDEKALSMAKFHDLSFKILNGVNDYTKQLEESINTSYLCIENIEKHYKYLSILYNKMKSKDNFSSLFDEMEGFLSTWKKTLFRQFEYLKEVGSEMKISKFENKIFESSILQKREAIKAKFESEKKHLENKKEKLWSNADISKWEFSETLGEKEKSECTKNKDLAMKYMCFKETNFVNELSSKLGYFNQRVKDEHNKLIATQFKRTKDALSKFLESFYITITDGITSWTNFNMNLSMII